MADKVSIEHLRFENLLGIWGDKPPAIRDYLPIIWDRGERQRVLNAWIAQRPEWEEA